MPKQKSEMMLERFVFAAFVTLMFSSVVSHARSEALEPEEKAMADIAADTYLPVHRKIKLKNLSTKMVYGECKDIETKMKASLEGRMARPKLNKIPEEHRPLHSSSAKHANDSSGTTPAFVQDMSPNGAPRTYYAPTFKIGNPDVPSQ